MIVVILTSRKINYLIMEKFVITEFNIKNIGLSAYLEGLNCLF